MHKPVRYYITESNDQPVVRSVQVMARNEIPAEPPMPVESETEAHIQSRLSRLSSTTKKLIPHRTEPPRR